MNKMWSLPLTSSQLILGDGQTGMGIGITTQGEACSSTAVWEGKEGAVHSVGAAEAA